MAAMTRFDKIVLGLTAAFLVVTGGYFVSGQLGEAEYQVTVSKQAPAVSASLPEVEDGYPDSLLEDLAQGREVSQDVSANPEASLLLFCGLREKRLDKLLFELRREEVTVEYKAILTPVNRTWTLRHLYLEMQREKAAISRKS